jgi:hypothetical protein
MRIFSKTTNHSFYVFSEKVLAKLYLSLFNWPDAPLKNAGVETEYEGCPEKLGDTIRMRSQKLLVLGNLTSVGLPEGNPHDPIAISVETAAEDTAVLIREKIVEGLPDAIECFAAIIRSVSNKNIEIAWGAK